MRAALLSYWTLFFGILLFMAGNGLQGALLGNRAETLALRLDWDMDRCLACLSALEVQGWINKGPKGYSAMR